jgi:hypothetical protein
VPTQPAAHRMITGVETIAGQRSQVDTPDERDLVVDDHQLLMVAVHRPLARIERALHARAPGQLVAYAAHRGACRRERRHRRSRPQQHPNLDSFRELTQQIPQTTRLIVAGEPEVGRNMPAGDVHARVSPRQRLGDTRQRLPAINQNIKRAPQARRRITRSPQRRARRRMQLADPTNPSQPTTMMPTDRCLDPVTRPSIRHAQATPSAGA